MTQHEYKTEDNSRTSGFDYESAYSAAENATLTPKDARESRAEVIEEELEARESPRETRARLRAEEKKTKTVRNVIIIISAAAVVLLAVALAVVYINKAKQAKVQDEETVILETEIQTVSVSELYTYGTHLNITGTLPESAVSQLDKASADLILYNGEFISVPIVINDGTFAISEQYNGGIYLDGIDRGTYKLFIRLTADEPFDGDGEYGAEDAVTAGESGADPAADNEAPGSEYINDLEMEDAAEESSSSLTLPKKKPEEESEEETTEMTDLQEGSEEGSLQEETAETEKYYKYYALVNNSGYDETTYYTMSSVGNCVVIGNEYDYPTMQIDVRENTEEDVYDVVIDAAHGGADKGASGVDGHAETEYLLPLALKIKADLEDEGVKVALTRDNDSETLDIYGEDGRIARACRSEAKYMISLHMNDAGTGTGGLEIYTYANLDYTFADLLNDNIQRASGLKDSANTGQIGHNLYTQQFTQKDIDEVIADNTAAGLRPYEPTVRSSYFFIIRESGGIVTGAFRDDRNPQEQYNPYCYDNTGIETYILQLGYITHEDDLNIMTTKMDEIAGAIADSLISVAK